MRVTLRQGIHDGNQRWILDWEIAGKRKRRFFADRSVAEEARDNLLADGIVSAEEFQAISESDRSNLSDLYRRARQAGVDLSRVLDAAIQNPKRVSTSKSLSEILDECLAAKRAANLNDKYVTHLKWIVSQFIRGREAMRIGEISTEDLETWANTKSWTPQTRATVFSRLSAFFAFAVQRKYLGESPADGLHRVRIRRRPPRILSAAQANEFIRNAPKALIGYIAVAMFLGARPEETEKLRWDQIDLDRGRLWINEVQTKTGQRRIVDIPPNVVEWLRLAPRFKGKLCRSHSSIRRDRKRLCARLNLQWESDLLRHTAASMMLAWYEDAPKVALQLGHSVKVLMTVYRELVTREEAEVFFAIRPIGAVAAVA